MGGRGKWGYSGFQVTGMIEWGQKSKPPKIPRASQSTQLSRLEQTNIIIFPCLFKIQESVHAKLICPGKVTSVACSPDGAYCVAACGEKIYIWQV